MSEGFIESKIEEAELSCFFDLAHAIERVTEIASGKRNAEEADDREIAFAISRAKLAFGDLRVFHARSTFREAV